MIKYSKIFDNPTEYPLDVYRRKAQEYQGKIPLIDTTIGDPQEATLPSVYQSIIDEAQNSKGSSYPLAGGNPKYHDAVLSWAKREYNFYGTRKNVCSSNGSKEAIFHFPLLFDWRQGQKVFFAEISYPVYRISCEMYGIPYKDIPMKEDFSLDLSSFTEKDWTQCQIFWINSPHNPTSTVLSRVFVDELVKKAKKYDFFIASDECYNDIYYEQRPTSLLEYENSKNWIVFRSLSKRNNMTGIRCGAIISNNEQLMERYRLIRSPIGVGTPNLLQNAAIRAWEDDSFITQARISYLEKRDLLSSTLKEQGFEICGAQGGFYLWFKHPNYSGQEIFDKFLELGIVVTVGIAFGEQVKDFIRMVYCLEMQQCKELAKRIHQLTL